MKTKTAEEYVASWDSGLAKALTGAVDQETLEEAQCLVALFEQIFAAGAEAQRESDAYAVDGPLRRAGLIGADESSREGVLVRANHLVTLPEGEG